MNGSVLTCSLREMIDRVKNEPKKRMVYSGIKENSIGFVFGPSKSGKTIFCENLGMSIASGQDSFMGLPIDIENKRVLFISLEEFWEGRAQRNLTQLTALSEAQIEMCFQNYTVVNDDIPKYVSSEEDWQLIRGIIEENHPGVVFIDSLSRLYEGSIEDSKVGKRVMKQLRELCDEMKITLIIIHHTPKIGNSPLTVDSMAGSRMLAQDSDFAIGINKVSTGQRYVKDVFFRYAPENDEMVRVFEIDKGSIWLKAIKEDKEAKLLFATDGRSDTTNHDLLLEAFPENGSVTTKTLMERFVNTKCMTKATMHNQINKLVKEGSIIDVQHGVYKRAA
ncbi:MAG: AAA family ATPase [Bacteroidetes bacterium]|nr:AAA family ATPase [Bacteroidota bacterium]